MKLRFLDIIQGQFVINESCLLVPEFKKIVDTHSKPVLVFKYIKALLDPESPYDNIPEDEKENMILKDLGIDFSLDDLDVQAAKEKAEKLSITPTERFFQDSKVGLEKMGKYLRDGTITAGRDGNDSTFLQMLKSTGKIIQEFKQLEKQRDEEVSELRGGQEKSYDEN